MAWCACGVWRVSLQACNLYRYVADSFNHRIRRMNLADIIEIVVQEEDTVDEAIGKFLFQNLVLLLLISGGLLGLCIVTCLMCRYCFACPVYQRRLHEKFVKRMMIGQRNVRSDRQQEVEPDDCRAASA